MFAICFIDCSQNFKWKIHQENEIKRKKNRMSEIQNEIILCGFFSANSIE